jgi:peptidoglycan/LPS O-acetylase OafA/YrhL
MNTAQLTFLRFIGATSVVIYHFGRNADSLAWANIIWDRANASVSFFFVLSGFILAHVYGGKSFRAVDFYVARIARVLPLYWIALLLTILYEPRNHPLYMKWVLLSATLIQSWWIGYSQILNVPGWTLSVDVFFYLQFPFLLRMMSRWRTVTILAIAGVAWALNISVHGYLNRFTDPYQYPYLRDFTYFSPFAHMATLLVGLAGGIVFHRWHPRLRRAAIPLLVGSLALFFATLFLTPHRAIHYLHNGLLAPLFVVFLWGLGSNPNLRVARWLRWSPLVALGEASYGIYILHFPVLFMFHALADRFELSVDAFFWIYYAVLVLVSLLALKEVDAPLRKAIKRFHSKFLRRVRAEPGLPLAR